MTGRALALALTGFVVALGPAARAAPPSGFQACSACHLPDGKGVPGAFPPLVGRVAQIAATTQGRNYLVQVLAVGVTGEMAVGATTYRGFMPRQSTLSAAEMAEVLNYLASDLGDGGEAKFEPFTAAEIERLRGASPTLTPGDVAKLRDAGVAGEHR